MGKTVVKLAGIGRWIWSRTDNLTKWIQAVGLVAAGLWATHIYYERDKPTLEPRLGTGFEINSSGPGPASLPNSCAVSARVWVRNSGLLPIDVNTLQLKMWKFTDVPITEGEFPKFMDLAKIERGEPVVFPALPLLLGKRMPPNGDFSETFVFYLPKPTIEHDVFEVELSDGRYVASGGLFPQKLCQF